MRKYLASLTAVIVIAALLTTQSAFGAIQTFGNTGNNASTQTNSADRKYVYSATPSSDGTVVSGSARIWNGGTVTSNTKLVIYSDTAGEPDALLAVSDEFALTTAMNTETARAYTFSGANQIAITSGTPYWIGVHFSDPGTGNISISRANTVGLTRSEVDTYSDGTSDPCGCAVVSNGGLDIYIEYDDTPIVVATTTKQSTMSGGLVMKGGVTIR